MEESEPFMHDHAIPTENEEQDSATNVDGGIPHVGMQFRTAEEAWDFYNVYAEREGFSIRRSSTAKGKDGNITRRLYVCNKEGFKSLTDKREVGREVNRRKNEREGCMARMKVHRISNEVWGIKSFHDVHNHELIKTPSKIHLLRSHKRSHMDVSCRNLVDQFRGCGVGPSKIARILNATSSSNVNITTQQCIDHLRVKRKNNIGKECTRVIQQFLTRQATDSQFYYAMEHDEENVCRSIFWADGRARTSYLQFGDVVVFDVTYKTNHFLLPFAPFTGVNHHKQSILFGCALLADEKEDTFVWLFENWLTCMWGKAPGAIITDQDPAICNAIKRVFPNTRHRYCIWHISLHENEHLRSLRSAYNPEFDEDYVNWSKKSESVEEAESCWVILKEKYQKEFSEPMTDKQKNEVKSWKWLHTMHEKARHWIKAYLKDTFFAGMASSQRSESMNSFFDGYVNSMTPLYEFIDQYDKAVHFQRNKEEKEDTFCMRNKPEFRSMHELEVHAAKVYTRNVFSIFQTRFKDTLYCRHERVCIEGDTTTYHVHMRIDGKSYLHSVRCNISMGEFTCTCARFETEGLLCTQILYIMKQKFDMQAIPERYILPRWTLNARHSIMSMGSSSSSAVIAVRPNQLSPLQSWCLRATFDKVL